MGEFEKTTSFIDRVENTEKEICLFCSKSKSRHVYASTNVLRGDVMLALD